MKIAALYDARAPFAGVRPGESDMQALRAFADVFPFDADFDFSDYTAILHLHGAYFPKAAFAPLRAALARGAGLVCLGGETPFSRPVRADGTVEAAQSAYHNELNIHHAQPIPAQRYTRTALNDDLPLLAGYERCFPIADTLGFIVRFTQYKDIPWETGSGGPMDARLLPLLRGFAGDRQTAAPAVLIENTKGAYEGSRWTFLNGDASADFWSNGGARLLGELGEFVSHGVLEWLARPGYASYYPSERPTLQAQFQSFGTERDAVWTVRIEREGELLYEHAEALRIMRDCRYITLPVEIDLQPGSYALISTLAIEHEAQQTQKNGFWGYDKALLQRGEPLRCGRDYFYRGDTPLPIVGMTYMQSDVHRRFIELPNPYLWDADIAEMARAGINMIRTGIWTAHRTVGFLDGFVRESVLRAIDALFLTAKKHDIPLVFNFFAFTPESWEGANPYLDPRSLQAQKRFIACIAGRYAGCTGISWDLINEPSLMTTVTQWKPAVSGDAFERAAWVDWLRETHGNDIEALRERWNFTPEELPDFESAGMPSEEELFAVVQTTSLLKPVRVHDYLCFQQHVHTRWAAELVAAIRAAGSTEPVTVGQDEGLDMRRPSPLFYQEAVDYTTCHSWWLMDDLYWDSVFGKDSEKPCLIQETGIMYVQNVRGEPFREEATLRNILERKYALAFASGNAGAVHWIWNTNLYMDSFNEVNIGAIRADGSQKLEADVSYRFGAFIRECGRWFEGRKAPAVHVVYPYANNFSIRDGAREATKRTARMLGYTLHVPMQAYGEYHLENLPSGGLILLPCARNLSDAAWETLLARVRAGSTLLITGAFSADEYGLLRPERAEALGLETRIVPAEREERLWIDGKPWRVAFGGLKLGWIEKERCAGRNELREITLGAGRVLFSPLPLELSEDEACLEAAYRYAMEKAGVQSPVRWRSGCVPGILAQRLIFEQRSVWVFVSEAGEDAELVFGDGEHSYRAQLASGRVLLFATDTHGELCARLPGCTVEKLDT